MKKQALGLCAALSTLAAPSALAHTGANADHSHFAANVSAWLSHIFTAGGHQITVACIALLVVGGATIALQHQRSDKRN